MPQKSFVHFQAVLGNNDGPEHERARKAEDPEESVDPERGANPRGGLAPAGEQDMQNWVSMGIKQAKTISKTA